MQAIAKAPSNYYILYAKSFILNIYESIVIYNLQVTQ